jgi:hypothetical protein
LAAAFVAALADVLTSASARGLRGAILVLAFMGGHSSAQIRTLLCRGGKRPRVRGGSEHLLMSPSAFDGGPAAEPELPRVVGEFHRIWGRRPSYHSTLGLPQGFFMRLS